ncbi:spore germination protein [Paenibacillus psychroresistens]|uniref:Spore germination protein n=1 Tax=Paenibacillus psychroresistens TaxID=1778678 RepID=A0A6B8RPW4_9BACL|nr:spore germination protein [Paenibacillus psychroresistens]QGQ97887.1 spore germination protein [Paenibacillus psychroresistens]
MEDQFVPISPSIVTNLEKLKLRFSDNELLVIRYLGNNEEIPIAAFVYINVLIDEKRLNQQIIRKISEDLDKNTGPLDVTVIDSIYSMGAVHVIPLMEPAINLISDAGILIFVEGHSKAYGIPLPGFVTRPVDEPMLELNVRGPREGFTEDLQKNLGMVYRRMKSANLKAKSYVIGRQSQTKVILLYLDNKVNPDVLTEVKERIEKIDLDVLVDSAQVEEWIQDNTFSPFPQILNTERPDRIITALNRGKITILIDGTPIALVAPSTFFEMMHPSEDLYERFYFANFLRVMRLITMFVSLFGPSLYIALTTFHLEMIPTPLMLAFLSTKAGIPFPTFVEALLMEVSFEVLREASLRLPRTVGQSVSIVGALIIGEAAVQSGIVSRPMVIVVAMTGIASFSIPSFSTGIAFRILRFPLMFLAASTGVFGISLGFILILLHLSSLQFCGVPFFEPINSTSFRNTVKKFILLPVQLRSMSNHKKTIKSLNQGNYHLDIDVEEYDKH